MRHDQLRGLFDRLGDDLGCDCQAGHNIGNGTTAVAKQQSDIVPIFGEPTWCESFKELAKMLNGGHGTSFHLGLSLGRTGELLQVTSS